MSTPEEIRNFGGNVRFRPRHIYAPTGEAELLSILTEHRAGKVRVVGSKHAWSPAIETDDALVDMRHFNTVRVFEQDGRPFVAVGGGCQIKHLLKALNSQGLTTPSVGLITEQTVAGATSTGTHGSGRHSLSHYIHAMRIACFEASGQKAVIVEVTGGVELEAARCALGCLGVVVEITLPCVPQYFIEEQWKWAESIEAALTMEADTPLQQFFLLPHAWRYIVQRRRVVAVARRSALAWLYRIYIILTLDIGMHLLVKLSASVLNSRSLIYFVFRWIMPACVIPRWVVVDRSDRQLVMEHELFRHLETEIFVRRSQVPAAARFVVEMLTHFDDVAHELSADVREQLAGLCLAGRADALRGTFTHHFPICFRRILPDDTLLSMAAGDGEDWYAISLITYIEPRESFYAVSTFLADSMHSLFGARVHWGKWFPCSAQQVSQQYPRLEEFRQVCRKFDPGGIFRNRFVAEKLELK